MLTVPTTCPFCGCGCGVYLLVNRKGLVGVAPSESHPVSQGKLCARGWSAHEAALWGARLKQPLIRRNGSPEPTSWNVALDHLTRRIKELIDAGRPVGVLGSARATNEENYLAGKLARAGLDTNHVDFCYHANCRPMMEGLEDATGACAASASLQDVESSETILLIEGDLAESHPQVASGVMRALERGARLVTVGCRRTQMARLSSLHFPTTPGSEGEVINGLLAATVRWGRQDRGAATAESAADNDLRRDLETIKATDELRQAGEWIKAAQRATFLVPPPSGQRERSRRNTAALATLAAMTGHLNRPGSGLLLLLARSNVRGACDMGVAPDRLPGYDALCGRAARERLQNLWDRDLPSAPGMEVETLLQSVSGLIIVADDPPSALPMGQRALAALRNIEFVAVLDAFVSPSTGIAHVALPIASFAETEGTLTSMEGRVQRLRVATDPPGEARPGWQVLAELCGTFGLSAPYNSAADVLREIARAAPQYAMVERVLDEGWSETRVQLSAATKRGSPSTAAAVAGSRGRPYVLAHLGAFDWGRDPLVAYSPTLSRDSRSERKLFPRGCVEIGPQDADGLGVNGGRRVRLISDHGQAVVPVRRRADLKPGVLLVPYAFRDHVVDVLGTDTITGVTLELV